MKQFRWLSFITLSGCTAAWLASCTSEPRRGATAPPVARWHFVGATQLQSQTAAPALATLLTGTNSSSTGERLATNLTVAVLQRLGRSDVPAATAVLAPLMADLLRHESVGEVAAAGWRMNVKLPAERWASWQQAGGLLSGLASNFPGAVLTYTNGWLTAGAGSVTGIGWLTLSNGAVLAAEGDLAKILNGAENDWPRVQIEASLEGNQVKTRAGMDFLNPPLQSLPAWKLPERRAHGPFSQFTAIRGISALSSRIGWWREAFAGQPPDQIFWWAQPEVPFRSWMAVPTKDPAGDIRRLFTIFGKVFGETGVRSGRLAMATNLNAFAILDTLKGLQPVVSHVKQGDDAFIMASLYPATPTTNAISAELRRLLSETNLVYQDAEFTPESIDHWNILFQLNQMLQSNQPNARNARAHSWMFEHRALLGDAETSVRQLAPTRFALERKSSAGLTGIELVILTRWLDGDDYRPRSGSRPALPTDSATPGSAKP